MKSINEATLLRSSLRLPALRQKIKFQIIKNNLRVIFCFNIICFSGMFFSMVFQEWFELLDSPKIYAGLLFVYDSDIVEKYTYNDFEKRCPNYSKVKVECKILPDLEKLGITCLVMNTVGMFLHLIYMTQILLTICDRTKILEKPWCPRPIYIKNVVWMLFIGSFLLFTIWGEVLSKTPAVLGPSYWVMLACCIVYLICVIYYNIIKKELKKRQLIDNLLDVDKYLLDEIGDSIDIIETTDAVGGKGKKPPKMISHSLSNY